MAPKATLRAAALAALVAGAASQSTFCAANGYSSTTAATAATYTVAQIQANVNNAAVLPSCFPTQTRGFVTVTGVITGTAAGKGLGYSATSQLAWIADVPAGSTYTPGTGLALTFTAGLVNSVNRGDFVNVTGWLFGSSAILEVCAAPIPAGQAKTVNGNAAYIASLNTAMFSSSPVATLTVGATFPTYNATQQPPAGLCTNATKPLYDGALATFTGATILRCSNPVSVGISASSGGISASSGKVANYGVCQPSNTPLVDTYAGAGNTGLCNTCMWDKYSTFWISTDGGVTGIAVSTQLFRPFSMYTMTVGAPINITGLLSYNGFSASSWTLTLRDQYDITGLPGIPANAQYPTAVIGSQTTGVKQQLYVWASPGPYLAPALDPNGVTAAANLPIGMPLNIVGPTDSVANGVNGVVQYSAGTGIYNPAWPLGGGATYDHVGCPNASGFAYIYFNGQTTQNLCACYPPAYYSPMLGANGFGTTYVKVSGIVTFIEGITSGSPPSGIGSFYLQSGPGPNQALYVYQNGAAGVSVTLGDSVTITATAYSYYGLVEMQNTLSVVINSHGGLNAVYPPLALADLSAVDVTSNGHCSAYTMLYRANRVTIPYLTVTKLVMYEPYPTNFNYWFNGSSVPLYSAAFNSTILNKKSNWFNSNLCGSSTTLHPVTGQRFYCSMELTDQFGHRAIMDECPYGSTGGLMPLFMNASSPIAVGDVFTSVTALLKYSQGGTFREPTAGGNLMLCATSDPTLMAGRIPYNPASPFVPPPPSGTVASSVTLTGYTSSTFNVPAVLAAFRLGVANTTNVPFGAVNITSVTDTTVRRALLAAGVSVAFSIAVPNGVPVSNVNSLLTASSLTTNLQSSFSSTSLPLPSVTVLNGVFTTAPPPPSPAPAVVKTTTDNKGKLALGLGLGLGLGIGVPCLLAVLYFTVLKKKNVEAGEKKAVQMMPSLAAAPVSAGMEPGKL